MQVLSYIRYYALFAYFLSFNHSFQPTDIRCAKQHYTLKIWWCIFQADTFKLRSFNWIWFKLNILCIFTSLTSLTIELGNIVNRTSMKFRIFGDITGHYFLTLQIFCWTTFVLHFCCWVSSKYKALKKKCTTPFILCYKFSVINFLGFFILFPLLQNT